MNWQKKMPLTCKPSRTTLGKMTEQLSVSVHGTKQTWPCSVSGLNITLCGTKEDFLKVSPQGVRMSQNSTKSFCMKFWLWIRSSSEGKYCMLSSCMRRLSSPGRCACTTRNCPGGDLEPCALGLSKRPPLAFSRTPRYESISVSSVSLSQLLLPLSLPTESERMCSIWYFSCIRNWLVFLGARMPLALFPLTLTGLSDITCLWRLGGWWWL